MNINNPALGNLMTQFGGQGGGASFVSALVTTAITIILVIGSLYFFFQLITGAVDWIRSGGDKASLESARGKVISAVIGLVLLFSAWAIIRLIGTIFNINLFQLTIPTLQG